jgi:2,3-bisphosphoglycerate-independent phosphoglycerate mutase
MEASAGFLRDHPVNGKRRGEGKAAADTFWFWGAGKRPALPTLQEVTGLSGAVISAVDLVNGIGVLAGLERVAVPGATGYVDTDYGAKARYALKALETHDLVFVHIEAPDEAGHQGDAALKVRAIESVDREFLAPVLDGVESFGGFRILVSPDHPTPVALRTHTGDPVPFVISPAPAGTAAGEVFDENAAAASGLLLEEGHRLLDRLLDRP